MRNRYRLGKLANHLICVALLLLAAGWIHQYGHLLSKQPLTFNHLPKKEDQREFRKALKFLEQQNVTLAQPILMNLSNEYSWYLPLQIAILRVYLVRNEIKLAQRLIAETEDKHPHFLDHRQWIKWKARISLLDPHTTFLPSSLKKIVMEDPDDLHAHLLLAEYYHRQKEYPLAINELSYILRFEGFFIKAHYQLANIFHVLKLPKKENYYKNRGSQLKSNFQSFESSQL